MTILYYCINFFSPGVDMVPIKQIANVITLQDDITTQKCKQVNIKFWLMTSARRFCWICWILEDLYVCVCLSAQTQKISNVLIWKFGVLMTLAKDENWIEKLAKVF